MQKLILTLVLVATCVGMAFGEDNFDFRNAKWGMSSDECYDSEKFKSGIIKEDYDELKFKGMIFDNVSNISYQFKDNKLYKGYIAIIVDNASEAQKIFSSIKTKIAERAIHSDEYDMYHISFSTKNTNIDLGITNDSNLYLVLAGYRASDLKSIGLEKYAETPPNPQDLEGF
ncbi:hypothetical protein [uncultured Bilophila sp.]|uniref:hypothetical protein n=1 Tax=uncultured Bilophila sp. TaxID=529385 RepID=UPI0025933709|nr:hypothetical protein [uncultured Bilophila sp.]